ncbi:MAG: hypothetical protein Ct9H300mP1_35370 [Planctomycetaceae bacterium]|nr:MAG: hypothetical protein Ct9H300mP1_35370 [Planctomycetaceae bacterium]
MLPHAGVVDHDVNLAVLSRDRREHRTNRLAVGHIQFDRTPAQPFGGDPGLLNLDVANTTFAPPRDNSVAISSPSPLAAPVTMAVHPLRSKGVGMAEA